MNARQLIATSVLAISATVPAVVMASPVTHQGDGTSHVYSVSQQRDQITRQTVLNEYQQAVKSGEITSLSGDATVAQQVGKSNATRADVLGKIMGANLNEGDAS